MSTNIIGRMHEQTFNEALAEALRNYRRSWRENENYNHLQNAKEC